MWGRQRGEQSIKDLFSFGASNQCGSLRLIVEVYDFTPIRVCLSMMSIAANMPLVQPTRKLTEHSKRK